MQGLSALAGQLKANPEALQAMLRALVGGDSLSVTVTRQQSVGLGSDGEFRDEYRELEVHHGIVPVEELLNVQDGRLEFVVDEGEGFRHTIALMIRDE